MSMHQTAAGSPFLALPGELRNRIYSHAITHNQFRVLRNPVWRQPRPADHTWNPRLWQQPGYGLTQTCRSIRAEYLPMYRAVTPDNVLPQDLYEYIDAFARVSGTSDDQIRGSVVIDFGANFSSILDVRPLLRFLRGAEHFHVGTYDVIELPGDPSLPDHDPVPDIRDILTSLYDIVDWDAFYAYVEGAMTMLEIECDDTKGVEIVFELGAESWEDWMGVWSRPQDDPESRVGIPLEIAEKVVEWGRGCGMQLNRAEGSHLTVNFRRDPRVSIHLDASLG